MCSLRKPGSPHTKLACAAVPLNPDGALHLRATANGIAGCHDVDGAPTDWIRVDGRQRDRILRGVPLPNTTLPPSYSNTQRFWQLAWFTLVNSLSAASAVHAQGNPYHITAQERAACSADAERLCSDSYPDEGRLLVCMKANRQSLGPNCAAVFTAGLKQRGLL